MKLSDLLASFGVIILLIAFIMKLSKKWSAENRFYISFNFVGATVCCCASYLIRFYPFVILKAFGLQWLYILYLRFHVEPNAN